MSERPLTPLRQRARLLARLILAGGLVSAVIVFVTATPRPGLPAEYDVTTTKLYRHQMELYGGKANVAFDHFLRWFGGLWHGRPLAGSIVALSLLAVLAVRVAVRLEGGRDEYNPAPGGPR